MAAGGLGGTVRHGQYAGGGAGAYPAKRELLETLADAEKRLCERLLATDETALSRPLLDERVREILPTLGHAVLHVLVGHTAAHLGQLAVWRRAMGLPLTTTII